MTILNEHVFEAEKPIEEDVILNSHVDVLYTPSFEKGKYFQVVTEDQTGFEIQFSPRVMFKVVYISDKDNITSFEIIKLSKTAETKPFSEKDRVLLSSFSMSQLINFLGFIKSLDLKSINERKITLSDDSELSLDYETKKKIQTLLEKDDGLNMIEELLKNGSISSKDLVNTGYRKEQLEIFRKLLEDNYLSEYKKEIIVNENTKDELAWQYFFNKNPWIFGYGLDYRFMGILQKEFSASDTEADGSGQVNGDFLIGDKKFTTFIELKKPDTALFKNSTNRSGAWKLSSELMEAMSQILEQKAAGQIKLDGIVHDEDGNEIRQNSYDSKTILIIGNWSEINENSDLIKRTKEKTLELFRRDSRNIEIITYDELYERAKFIVEK